MIARDFWLPDLQWAALAPPLPMNQPGARQVDGRVISVFVHMLRNGGCGQGCPACCGPSTIIYSRFHRCSDRGIWSGCD